MAEGERFLDAATAALVIRGEAGIGKSVLWDEILARAPDRDQAEWRVPGAAVLCPPTRP